MHSQRFGPPNAKSVFVSFGKKLFTKKESARVLVGGQRSGYSILGTSAAVSVSHVSSPSTPPIPR